MQNKDFQKLGKTPRTLYVELLDDIDASVLRFLPEGSRIPSGVSYREVKSKVLSYVDVKHLEAPY